jgi:hypothetical protein
MNFAVGKCTDPIFKLASTARTPRGQEFLKTLGFRAPRTMFENVVQNSDTPVHVIDRCGNAARPSGFSMWAANVRYDGTLVLKSGGDGNLIAGSFDHRTNGLDYRAPSSNSPDFVNTTSRGRIPEAFTIRDALVRKAMAGGGTGVVAPGAVPGTLGHTLAVFFVETSSAAGFQEPMVGAESGKNGCFNRTDICAEGQYTRYNPNAVIPASCTPEARVIMKTWKNYGAYIQDNSGSGSGFKAEAGTTLFSKDELQSCMSLNQIQILRKGYVPPHS